MKRLIIGDIHGHWDGFKKIYDLEDPDEVIMLGDYFDNFHGSDDSIYECYRDILSLRNEHLVLKKGDFIMLFGNHDFHYNHWFEKCSGYRSSMAVRNAAILNDYSQHLQFVYVDEVNNTIYSHAGVTNTWLKENLGDKYDKDSYLFINEMNHRAFIFTYKGGGDWYGNTIYASPIWCRPRSLNEDSLINKDGEKMVQIVGHTHSRTPICYDFNGYEMPTQDEDGIKLVNEHFEDVKIYVMDTMPNYYIVEELDDEKKLVKREMKSLIKED